MRADDSERDSLTVSGGISGAALTTWRSLSLLLCILFSVVLIATIAIEGSPFYWSILNAKWMRTTLLDYYLTLLPFLVFVYHRERRSTVIAVASVVYCCCLGSAAVWSYVFLVTLRLKAGDPLWKVLN
jgi:hypothetical protein